MLYVNNCEQVHYTVELLLPDSPISKEVFIQPGELHKINMEKIS